MSVLLSVVGCVESGIDGPSQSAGVLQVNANLNSTVAGTLVIEVTATDITTPLVFDFVMQDGLVSGTITLPAGSDRTLTLRAYDTDGVETHRAALTISVREGSNPAITVSLLPLSADQPIDVTLGTIAITVSRQYDTVSVGEAIQLSAAVTDATGDTVDLPVAWATLGSAVATVDEWGAVSGQAVGSTQIVATYGRVGGAATVIVEPALTWTLVTGLPGENLSAVWGSATDDVYNAGGYRSFNHYDGTGWTAVGYAGGANRNSVFGLSPTQVYSAGQRAPGQGHAIARFTASWQEVVTTGVELFDIWGSGPDDLYAVGDGTVMRWNGATWTSLPTGLSTAFNVDRLLAVWGSSSSNAYVGGYNRLMRWDGTAFTTISTGSTVLAIHGSDSSDVWSVGTGGVIAHFAGSTWESLPSGSTGNLNGVRVIAPNDVWLAGSGGLLLHWNGSLLNTVASPTTRDLGRVWAASRDTVYVGTFGPGAILVGTR